MAGIFGKSSRRDFLSGLLSAALIGREAVEIFAAEAAGRGEMPTIVSAENGGLLFTDNPAGVSGVDAGYSLPMGAQTLWLFGDVFLLERSAPSRRYVGGVSNCGLLVPRGRGAGALRRYRFLTDPATGLARQLIPNRAGEGEETRLWPLGGWHHPAKRRTYLYYAHVRTTGEGGPFGFRILGHGLSHSSAHRPEETRFERYHPLWWLEGGPLFGCATTVSASRRDPYLYLTGVEERDGEKIGKMARVHRDRIEDRDAYAYYAGGEASPIWVRKPSDAADVAGLSDFPNELSVSYNAYLGGYLAVHSVSIEPRLRLSLARHPWGPYRAIGEVGAPHRAFEKAFCYAGKEHPELAEEGGRVIYVTYVDSQRYWLQLLRITLARPGRSRAAT